MNAREYEGSKRCLGLTRSSLYSPAYVAWVQGPRVTPLGPAGIKTLRSSPVLLGILESCVVSVMQLLRIAYLT